MSITNKNGHFGSEATVNFIILEENLAFQDAHVFAIVGEFKR